MVEPVLSAIVDITERQRAERRFRLAIESAPSGMVMVDRQGNIYVSTFPRVQKFDATGQFLAAYGSAGTGDDVRRGAVPLGDPGELSADLSRRRHRSLSVRAQARRVRNAEPGAALNAGRRLPTVP